MKRYIYFDNAATTFPKPEEVYTFMEHFYRHCGVNVGRGQYMLADRARGLVTETREMLLQFFKCQQKAVVFTASATEALNIIMRGIRWDDEYNVYITPFEHNAVTRHLYYLKNIYKLKIIELSVNKETLEYDVEQIKYQFQEDKPNVVIMSHASNVCGLIAPIEDICDLSKKYNSINIIDMAQTAGLVETDLMRIKADYAVFAGHKTLYAPFGVAGFIIDRNSQLQPLLFGGTGIDSANQELPDTIPEKFEVGSLNIQAIAGLNAALKWINKIGVDTIRKKEIENKRKLVECLKKFSNISIIGLNDGVGIVSCLFDGYSTDSIGLILSDNDIAVRTGLHCSPTAHKFLGTYPSGTVRFSVSYFNRNDDFNRLFEVLEIIDNGG